MNPEELEKLRKTLGEEAANACKAAYEAADTTRKAELEKLVKELADGKAELTMIGEKLVKMEKAFTGISIKSDLGGGKQELGFNKGKMYRGLLLGNWVGADMEREIAGQVANKAMEAGVGSAGGFLIPTEMSNDIVQLVRERNVLRLLGVMEVNATRHSYAVPKITGGVSAYMVGEGKEITASQMLAGMIEMTPKKAAALVYVSREMIAAADPGFVSILESDLASALAELQMTQALYGNGGTSPNGLFNVLGSGQLLAADANGDEPNKEFFRKLRSKVPQKYAGSTMKFLMNEDVAYKIASVASAAAPDAAAIQADEVLVRNALGKDYNTTGLVRANKSKGSGNNLSEVFYGDWQQLMLASWWGGMRLESSTDGGAAFQNDLMAFKAVLPFDVGLRRPDALACATFVKSINT